MSGGRLARIVPALLAIAVLVAAGGAAATLLEREPTGYTEFAVLGPDGTAGGYPSELAVDERTAVVVSVRNRRASGTDYTVAVAVDGDRTAVRRVSLRAGGAWRESVPVVADSPGRVRVELALFRGDPTGEPLEELYFTVLATDDGGSDAAVGNGTDANGSDRPSQTSELVGVPRALR